MTSFKATLAVTAKSDGRQHFGFVATLRTSAMLKKLSRTKQLEGADTVIELGGRDKKNDRRSVMRHFDWAVGDREWFGTLMRGEFRTVKKK